MQHQARTRPNHLLAQCPPTDFLVVVPQTKLYWIIFRCRNCCPRRLGKTKGRQTFNSAKYTEINFPCADYWQNAPGMRDETWRPLLIAGRYKLAPYSLTCNCCTRKKFYGLRFPGEAVEIAMTNCSLVVRFVCQKFLRKFPVIHITNLAWALRWHLCMWSFYSPKSFSDANTTECTWRGGNCWNVFFFFLGYKVRRCKTFLRPCRSFVELCWRR